MITCRLYGRLGNQMFQIASTIGTAIKHNTTYHIPSSTTNAIFPVYFKHFPPLKDNAILIDFYYEKAHFYQEIPYNNHICLDGYFQSEKYFKHCREDVIKAFNLEQLLEISSRETILGDIQNALKDTVSIHVRRGDYLQLQDKHPVVTKSYITGALKHFLLLGYKKYLVFSDDIDWCKQNINTDNYPLCTFDYSEGKTEIADLFLMSKCSHHIISNSSFSWWAAWLNDSPNKIVIAPKIWFGKDNAHLDTRDLVPETWIKI